MLQPVIQLGTAIHCKGFSGGAMNRVQKLMHVSNLLSVQRSKGLCTVRILTNWALAACVAAVTQCQVAATDDDGWMGYLS